MTRKEAILYAIDIIRKHGDNDEESKIAIEKLTSIMNDLPLTIWSKDAIFDACDAYCKKHNKTYLTATDFKSKELPPHGTVKKRFGVAVQEFRDLYYPIPHKTPYHNVYYKMSEEDYTKEFARFCGNYSYLTQDEYNKQKPDYLPTWIILARMNGVERWTDLLEVAGVKFEKFKEINLCVASESRTGVVELIKEHIENKKNKL